MAGRVDESVWEERREWVRKQEDSGQSVAQFCRDNGLRVGNFHAWRHRLNKASGQSQDGACKQSSGTSGVQRLTAFVQLPLQPAAVANGPAWIEVSSADGMVVRVPASNLAALEVVLSSLNRTGQETRHA